MQEDVVERAERILGLKFKDPSLLLQALTHSSYEPLPETGDNERLEFLGDAVLKLVVADYAFHRNPKSAEGVLSSFLARVVSEISTSRAAKRIGLGECLLLGKGLDRSGGRSLRSTLADAFEALLGALFIDRGYEAARDFALSALEAEIRNAEGGAAARENYKALLQEKTQRMAKSIPVYEVIAERGPDHNKEFTVGVSIEGETLGVGSGHTKKEAEQNAAKAALEKLEG